MPPKERSKVQKERSFEVGMDEAWKANIKRTYDEFQQESLETIRHMRQHFDKMVSDAQQNDNARQVLANQALKDAVETSNMVGKQAVRHGDIAIDRQWNLEPSEGVAQAVVLASADLAALKAIGASIAAAVIEGLAKKG